MADATEKLFKQAVAFIEKPPEVKNILFIR
jgi:hypothetical protein